MSHLKEYIQRCESGEILVGKEIFQEFEILKSHFGNPDIRYDMTESDLRIKFIENECKHYEAPFAGKPFILTLRQKAFIEAFYSFKIYEGEVDRWIRLHQDYLLLIARKCGKTPLVGAMNLSEWFCGEKGTRILCSSNDYDQAALMFDAIDAMREESPSLESATRRNQKGIFFGSRKHPNRKGKFSSQNKGWIKKISAKTGSKEGKNIKVGSVDEVHELENNDSIMPIRQALSTQDEPIYGEITTEGFTEDGYLDERLREARSVLKGELNRPRWLIFLYTQDSEEEVWQDESTWIKSNPDLGTIKKKSFLKQMVEEAKTSNATRAYVLAKDFNIKQGAAIAWLQPNEILNDATFDLRDFEGGYYIGGNDFAETTDLCCSKLLLRKPNDKTIYQYSKYWIPERKLELSPDGVDYREWEKQGLITIIPDNTIDTSLVADWQWELLQEYDLKPYKCGYDNRFAKDYVRRMEEIFGEGITVNVPQNHKCLSNPMNSLEADLKGKLHNYNNNPVDYWCFKNTGVDVNNLGMVMPSKMKREKRIDGTAASLCCYAVYEWNKSEFMQMVG